MVVKCHPEVWFICFLACYNNLVLVVAGASISPCATGSGEEEKPRNTGGGSREGGGDRRGGCILNSSMWNLVSPKYVPESVLSLPREGDSNCSAAVKRRITLLKFCLKSKHKETGSYPRNI